MTDKQLLEYAAKAAGYKVVGYKKDIGVFLATKAWPFSGEYWNPLTDDGNALRLAVKLKLDLFFHPSKVAAHIAGGRIPPIRYIAGEEYSSDPYAATRRAITRAAAEIGKEME